MSDATRVKANAKYWRRQALSGFAWMFLCLLGALALIQISEPNQYGFMRYAGPALVLAIALFHAVLGVRDLLRYREALRNSRGGVERVRE